MIDVLHASMLLCLLTQGHNHYCKLDYIILEICLNMSINSKQVEMLTLIQYLSKKQSVHTNSIQYIFWSSVTDLHILMHCTIGEIIGNI